MKFFPLRRWLGFGKDEEQQHDVVSDSSIASGSSRLPAEFPAPAYNLPRRGFGVQVQVPVERAQLPPLLVPCPDGDGGLQGLNWYAKRQKIDEDGDVADEFLDEDFTDVPTSVEAQNRPLLRFKVKSSTEHAKVKKQELLPNGKIQHLVEHHGKLKWV